MNKYIIPAILGAVVLMAGMFAIAPVQKAATVHTSIASTIGELICSEIFEGGVYDPVNNECDSP